jgi:hypothetical protein
MHMLPSRRLIAVAALVAAPLDARAQVSAARSPAGCTYETCALRVEPHFFSAPLLLRGREGAEVGRLGGFGGGVDTLLAGPDSAAAHARRYVKEIRTANTLSLLSAAAFVVVATRTNWFRDDASDGDVAVGIAGTVLGLVAIPFHLHAEQNLSRAVWFYNAALAR